MVIDKRPIFPDIRAYFREYCQSTSVHGFRYFGERRTIFERIWWFFIFVICLTFLSLCIQHVYCKWNESPVIVNFSTKETPIYDIPFPAVTICPELKSDVNVFNYTDVMRRKMNDFSNVSLDEAQIFEYLSTICYKDGSVGYFENETFTEDFYRVLDEIKPPFIISDCTFYDTSDGCQELFTPIITEEGICYTFNAINRSDIYQDFVEHYGDFSVAPFETRDWSMDVGYEKNSDSIAYPHRALFSGASKGLTIELYTPMIQKDLFCKRALRGYRVVLHTPIRLPRPSENYIHLPLDERVMVAIDPSYITTSKSVEKYGLDKRECYFSGNKPLKYFKIYSQNNCQVECLTNFTLKICGCVMFYMPREKDTPICGTGSLWCVDEVASNLQLHLVQAELKNRQKSKKKQQTKSDRSIIKSCQCLPLCVDLTYNLETSQVGWKFDEELKAYLIDRNVKINETGYISILNVYFKSKYIMGSQRNELYGPWDFLANFGGLLGLFTGFSILSLMEIIYFLTVRLLCNIRLYGYWAGPIVQE